MNFTILASYLETSNKASITAIRDEFGNTEETLSSSMKLGSSKEKYNINSKFNRAASIALIRAVSTQLKEDIDDIVLIFKQRMRLVHKIRFGSAILTTMTGATSAILAAFSKVHHWPNELGALGVALITVIGGLLSLFADHFERTPTGVKFAGVDELTLLVELRTEVEKISIRVSQDATIPLSVEDISATVSLQSDIALKILRFKYLSS